MAFLPFSSMKRVPLIKNMQWLIAYFAEFCAPASAALDCLIVEYFADDKRFLTVVNLIPDTLEDLTKSLVVSVTAIH